MAGRTLRAIGDLHGRTNPSRGGPKRGGRGPRELPIAMPTYGAASALPGCSWRRIAVDWTHRVQTVANPLRYRQSVPTRIDRQFRRADARVDLTQTLSHN